MRRLLSLATAPLIPLLPVVLTLGACATTLAPSGSASVASHVAAPQAYADDGSPDRDARAQQLFVRGMTQAYLDNHEQALALYEEALRLSPGNGAVLSAAAESKEALGDYAAAIYYARQARDNVPENRHYHRQLAALQLSGGNAHDAATTYGAMVEHFPDDVEARYDLAQVLTISNRFQDAIAAYEALLDDLGEAPHVLRELLQLYTRRQDEQGVERTLRRLVEVAPHDADLRRMLADLYQRQGRTEEALAVYARALEDDPRDIATTLGLASLYRELGREEEADALLEEVLSREGATAAQLVAQAAPFVARSARDAEASDAADRLLRRALELQPAHADALRMLGELRLRQDAFAEGAALLYRALEGNPRNLQLWFQAAGAFLQAGDAARAAAVAEEGLVLFPGQLPLLRVAAYALTDTYRNDEAIARFEEALDVLAETAPGDDVQRSELLSALGLLYDRKRDQAASDSAYSRAVDADADNSLALNNYAYSLAQRATALERALDMATRAVELQPDNPSFMDTLGWVYFQMEDYARAVEWLERAVATGGASAATVEHLGDAHQALGHDEQARSFWRQSLEMNPDDERLKHKLEDARK